VEALNILKFSNRKVSDPVAKLLDSAIANAEENFGLNRDALFIHTITADEARTRKWRRFGAGDASNRCSDGLRTLPSF